MPYTTNPHLPRVRQDAADLVRRGWSTRDVARHFGYSQSAIVKWTAKARIIGYHPIPTISSRPHRHPCELHPALIVRILKLRHERNQCAEILHHRLKQESVKVSLSSVKRVLRRHGISRFSRWKKWHQYPERPLPEKPGILVEIDTIHDGPHADRLYVYALLDVCSRWGYAWPSERINTHRSLRFVVQAQYRLPFPFQTLQSDHGPEFSKWFTQRVVERGMAHRHSRIRTPNDNGHVERFIRTLQEECLTRINRNLPTWQREIPEYLRYYNHERPHMGLNMKTPAEVIPSY